MEPLSLAATTIKICLGSKSLLPALTKTLLWARCAYFAAVLTAIRFLPFLLRRLSIARPDFVLILSRKPWVRFRLTLLGWYVRFMVLFPFNFGQFQNIPRPACQGSSLIDREKAPQLGLSSVVGAHFRRTAPLTCLAMRNRGVLVSRGRFELLALSLNVFGLLRRVLGFSVGFWPDSTLEASFGPRPGRFLSTRQPSWLWRRKKSFPQVALGPPIFLGAVPCRPRRSLDLSRQLHL